MRSRTSHYRLRTVKRRKREREVCMGLTGMYIPRSIQKPLAQEVEQFSVAIHRCTTISGGMIWRSQLWPQLTLTGRYYMKAIHEWTWKSRHKRALGSSPWALATSHSSMTSEHLRQALHVRICRTSHSHHSSFIRFSHIQLKYHGRRRQCSPHQFRNALRSDFACSECNLKILLFIRPRRYFLTFLGKFSPKILKPS